MAKLFPCLWFDGNAEEAANFYATLVPDSHVDKAWRSPAETPSGPEAMILTVDSRSLASSSRGSTVTRTSSSMKRSRSSSTATTRLRSIGCGRHSQRAAASLARVAGSRTGSGCLGRSCRDGWTNCSMIQIPGVPGGRWTRCFRWARSRSLSWSKPPIGPDASESVAAFRRLGSSSHPLKAGESLA